MNDFLSQIQKNSTIRKATRILVEEFINRDYPHTADGAYEFQKDLEKEHSKINRWVLSWNSNTGREREIEDVIMDELNIPGN